MVLSVNNLLETLVNQISDIHNRTIENSKGRFLLKIKFPKGDEELKKLGKGKEVIDCIHNTFWLNNFYLGTAKEQSNNDILPATVKIPNDAHMYNLFSQKKFIGKSEENLALDELTVPNNENKKKRCR